MKREKELFIGFGNYRLPILRRTTYPNDEYWAFLVPKLGLHLSLHGSGVVHFRDNYGLDEEIDISAIREFDETELQEDLENFWYERDFGDRLRIIPIPDRFLTGPYACENKYGIYLKIDKLLMPMIEGITQIRTIENPSDGFLNELPTASLIFEDSNPLVSLYHPSINGFPPITFDSSAPWMGLDRTNIGRSIVSPLQKVGEHIKQLSDDKIIDQRQIFPIDAPSLTNEMQKVLSPIIKRFSVQHS